MFTGMVSAQLQQSGWRQCVSNELWPTFTKVVDHMRETLPLPTALACDITYSCVLQPVVEEYLRLRGWIRLQAMVSGGGPIYTHIALANESKRYKQLPMAIIHQLRLDKQDELRGDDTSLVLVRRRT